MRRLESECCIKEQIGSQAKLAHGLLQAGLKLIGNVHADCKTNQYPQSWHKKTCVPNGKPEPSSSSSEQAQNELERPKLVPVSLKAEV